MRSRSAQEQAQAQKQSLNNQLSGQPASASAVDPPDRTIPTLPPPPLPPVAIAPVESAGAGTIPTPPPGTTTEKTPSKEPTPDVKTETVTGPRASDILNPIDLSGKEELKKSLEINPPDPTVTVADIDTSIAKETPNTDDIRGAADWPRPADGGAEQRGAFGQRVGGGRRMMVMRHGGSPATESCVEGALKWLALHQEADGRWDAEKHAAAQKTDTAVTSLALLAFLGAGHTEKAGQYKDNVRRAVAWLKSRQNTDGLVFDATDAGAHRGVGYPHAIAGLALAEAAGMARVPETVAAAQKAVDYSSKVHQDGEGYERRGFRYTAKSPGDLSVTCWYAMQMKSAKVSGLKVAMDSFEGIIRFLDSVERKGAGQDKGFGPASVYSYMPDQLHENAAHRLTAMGTYCRQMLGWKKEDLEANVRWFVEKGGIPNGWGEAKTDLYYWYYGTLCTFQQGGDIWAQWNEGLKKTLLDNRLKDGDKTGSWDPVGDYSSEWGRVGQTAILCLCLEVYYRYLPVYRER